MIHKPGGYSFVSLFSGLGGLDLGFTWEGYRLVWANDLSENAVATHKLNFGCDAISGDITAIRFSEIPRADLIIGGPPCQSFSLLGQRDPTSPLGKLVFRFLDIVAAKRPRAFVMENVPGMAASKIGRQRLPDVLKRSFEDLGYRVAKLELAAHEYLVPQRRRRLVLVGCLGFLPRMVSGREFSKACYGVDITDFDLGAAAAIGDLGDCVPKGRRARYRDTQPSRFATLMRVAGLKDVSLQECPRMSETDRKLVEALPPGGTYRDIPDDIAPGRLLKFKATGGRTTTYGRLHPDRPAYTINTYFRRPNVGCNFHYSEPRLITPREAMRLQSIPDHCEIVFSAQDERNAFIGNAVPPLLARAIAHSLRRGLEAFDSGERVASSSMLPSQMDLQL